MGIDYSCVVRLGVVLVRDHNRGRDEIAAMVLLLSLLKHGTEGKQCRGRQEILSQRQTSPRLINKRKRRTL